MSLTTFQNNYGTNAGMHLTICLNSWLCCWTAAVFLSKVRCKTTLKIFWIWVISFTISTIVWKVLIWCFCFFSHCFLLSQNTYSYSQIIQMSPDPLLIFNFKISLKVAQYFWDGRQIGFRYLIEYGRLNYFCTMVAVRASNSVSICNKWEPFVSLPFKKDLPSGKTTFFLKWYHAHYLSNCGINIQLHK